MAFLLARTFFCVRRLEAFEPSPQPADADHNEAESNEADQYCQKPEQRWEEEVAYEHDPKQAADAPCRRCVGRRLTVASLLP